MNKTSSPPPDAAVALTPEATGMADYLRTEDGHAAIRRGLKDIEDGRVLVGSGSLEAELARRASSRRNGR